MKRPLLAAICGTLLFVVALQVLSLQAQNPANLPEDPVFRAEPRTFQDPIPQPVPDPLTSQPDQGPKAQDTERSEFAKYPVWLLIKPDGIRFLQHQEEIATNQHAVPPNAFLLGCMTVKFEGAAGEQKPDFQLSCEHFVLVGRYGTKQNLDVKGASLTFSTKVKQMRLKGTDELPLEYHSADAASETRMQAEEITLQLDSGPKTVTRYVPRKVEISGLPVTEYVPVTEQIAYGNSFQLSARNITNMEVIANPDATANQPARGDAPMWNPNPPEHVVPTYDDSSGDLGTPRTPQSNNNVPFYDAPSKPKTDRSGK